MVSLVIDFTLKNVFSLSKWIPHKGLNTLINGESLEKKDFETLQQAVDLLSNVEKLMETIEKLSSTSLKSSFSHVERGLIFITHGAQSYQNDAMVGSPQFEIAKITTLKSARDEFKLAYSKASDTFMDKDLSFADRVCAFKIVLIGVKMLYTDWEPVWDREIFKYFRMPEVQTVIKSRSSSDFALLLEFAVIFQFAISESGTSGCKKALATMEPLPCAARKLLDKYDIKVAKIHPNEIVDKNSGETLLHFAVKKNNSQAVRDLLMSESDLNIKDNNKRTPLHLAAFMGHVQCLKLLVRAGADVNCGMTKKVIGGVALYPVQRCSVVTFGDGNGTALHLAAGWGNLECLKELISSGASVNARDYHGYTALHGAAYYGEVDCLKELIEAGADKELKSNDGKTAFDIAANRGSAACMDLLRVGG